MPKERGPTEATVICVSLDSEHRFSKVPAEAITLMAGYGVVGDAHAGETVQHLSRSARDPEQPNLRQIHLIHAELFDELRDKGFKVAPADLGENITTVGVDLLGLSRGTVLHIGESAQVEVTGLRNPCSQINGLQQGLMKQMIQRDADGSVQRKSGVMGIVLHGGEVQPGDAILLTVPEGPHRPLECV